MATVPKNRIGWQGKDVPSGCTARIGLNAPVPQMRRADFQVFGSGGGWTAIPMKPSSISNTSPPELDVIIRNTYRTLVTRGMKGCAIWFAPDVD